jgi:hypothetical protein
MRERECGEEEKIPIKDAVRERVGDIAGCLLAIVVNGSVLLSQHVDVLVCGHNPLMPIPSRGESRM